LISLSKNIQNPTKTKMFISKTLFNTCLQMLILYLFFSLSLAQEPFNIPNTRRSVVRIIADGGGSIASGTVIKVERNKLFILTAYHVVQKDLFNDIKVKIELFSEEEEILARISRRNFDEDNDIALLVAKSLSSNLPPEISWGSSKSLGETQNVYSIGHPYGSISWAITKGIVSRLHGGKIYFSGNAVDKGNSGGPLLNHKGEMIGMNLNLGGNLGQALEADIIRGIIRTWVKDLPQPGTTEPDNHITFPAVSPPAPFPTSKPYSFKFKNQTTPSEMQRKKTQLIEELNIFLTGEEK